jgi:hypothetical protein
LTPARRDCRYRRLGELRLEVAASPLLSTEQRSRSLHPLLLRFADPNYREGQLGFRINALRVATLSAAVIWLVFTLLNSVTIQDPSQALFYDRVVGFVAAITICTTTVIARPGRWIEPVSFATIAVTIVQLTFVLAFMSRLSLPYYPPTEIGMILGVGSFAGAVTFVEGTLLAAGTICAFLISMIVLWPEPALVVVFHSAWVVSVIAFAGAGSYLLDRTQHISGCERWTFCVPKARFETCSTMCCPLNSGAQARW